MPCLLLSLKQLLRSQGMSCESYSGLELAVALQGGCPGAALSITRAEDMLETLQYSGAGS